MKSLSKAAAIIGVVCLALFFVLRLSMGNAEAAKLALTPFSAITLVNAKLEEKDKEGSKKTDLPTLHEFSFSFWKAFVLGTVSALALIELLSSLSGVLAAITGALLHNTELTPQLIRLVVLVGVPINLYIVFAAGRWIGIRSRTMPYATAAVMGITCRLGDYGLMLLAGMSPDQFRLIFGVPRSDIAGVTARVLAGVVLFAAAGLIGCWRGRRRQQAFYLDHLLKSVPAESRATLIAIAYDEAQKTMGMRTDRSWPS
jgi:hypothetical protein